jgi:hypothetical protein
MLTEWGRKHMYILLFKFNISDASRKERKYTKKVYCTYIYIFKYIYNMHIPDMYSKNKYKLIFYVHTLQLDCYNYNRKFRRKKLDKLSLTN